MGTKEKIALNPETGKWSTEDTKFIDVRIIDKGIMRRIWWGSKEIEEEMRKNNKPYHIWSADGSALIINYDEDKLRPMVKDYLARQGTLQELEWIKKVFYYGGSLLCVILVLVSYDVWQNHQVAKKVLSMSQENTAVSALPGYKPEIPQEAVTEKVSTKQAAEPSSGNSFFQK